MEISADNLVYWQWRFVTINATLVFSWVAMAVLAGGSALVTRRLTTGPEPSRWQNFLEVLVLGIRRQIREASQQDPGPYLPFVGTLFLFIATMNVLEIVPGFRSPAGSLSTTAALALCVFVAVPAYGVAHRGLKPYLRQYVEPSPFLLPFHIISEISRTVALAIRLFGNITSGTLIVAVLLSLAPLFFPVVMGLFGLLIGVIQAYVFAILALVYIASAAQAHRQERESTAAPAHSEGSEPKAPKATRREPESLS